MPFVQSSDFISKSGRNLAARNAVAPGGKPRTWGMLFTVTDDADPGINTTWFLKYNQNSTNLLDNDNWVTAASEFGGGGSSYTFENGLTEVSPGVVRLGGNLTANTLIASGAFALSLTHSGFYTSSIALSDVVSGIEVRGTNVRFVAETGSGAITFFSNSNGINFYSSSSTFNFYNPAGTFSYQMARSAIVANRTITLPLLTGNDTFVFENHTQTLTNKTFTSPVINTQISGNVTSGGNITTTNFLVGATATQTITNKTLTSPILNTPRLGTSSTVGYVWTATDTSGNGSWQAGGGGGIGGSTGSVDNALLRADGTGGSTLQSSPIIISDTGDIQLGESGTSGTSRSIVAIGTNANLDVIIQQKGLGRYYFTTTSGNAILEPGGSASSLIVRGVGTTTYTSIGSSSTNGGLDIESYTTSGNDIRLSATGGGKLICAGSGGGAIVNGGDLFLRGGAGTTRNGNVGFFTESVANWQSMGSGILVSNCTAEPNAGIANGTAIFAADVDSSSELFAYSEAGARVNISGLMDTVLESGTSLTLTAAHRNKIIYCTNAGAVTIEVPAGLQLGFNCVILQVGAGTVTLDVSAVTLLTGSKTATTGQADTIGLVLYAATDNYSSR